MSNNILNFWATGSPNAAAVSLKNIQRSGASFWIPLWLYEAPFELKRSLVSHELSSDGSK